MRWSSERRSDDLEDRRGSGFPGGRTVGIGLGGVLVLAVLSALTGTDFLSMLSQPDSTIAPTTADRPLETTPEEEKLVDFVSFVLDDVQGTWRTLLPGRYDETRLVLFRDAYGSACGTAESATGPFYCPADHKVYLDLGFFAELQQRFGAPGDFAQAYVLAHEIGHHVQSLLGTEERVRELQQRAPERQNEYSVRLELQADCYAGIWGHSTSQRNLLEAGDVEEGLGAASAVGDDRIQQMAGRRVQRESFTHGSAAQRADWFGRGFKTGQLEACNTFN